MKDIPGLEGRYAVTRDGRMWSHAKTLTIGMGKLRKHEGKWMKMPIVNGYFKAKICKGPGIELMMSVHRLVAETFIENRKKLPQVNHKNGNKLDNRVENLEWCTSRHNVLHAYKMGLRVSPSGDDHWRRKARFTA